jgi:hypothetical protein
LVALFGTGEFFLFHAVQGQHGAVMLVYFLSWVQISGVGENP